jgi:hypothetical protein
LARLRQTGEQRLWGEDMHSGSLRTIAHIGAIATASALMAAAPASASTPTTPSGTSRPAATAITIKSVSGGIGYGQSQPLPKGQYAKWTLHIGIDLVIDGVPEGSAVEVRLTQPSSGTDGWVMERIVEDKGSVRSGWGQSYPTLAEAEQNVPTYIGPMTVEVRASADDDWAGVTLDSWTVRDRLVLKNVSMKKNGKTLTFKGKVTTAQGVPVAGVGVQPVLFRDYGSGPIGKYPVQKTTNASGAFSVKVSGAKRGTVGMMIVERPDGAIFDWAFSRTFRNR